MAVTAARASEPAHVLPDGKRTSILFVDDDPGILRALRRLFRREEWRWDLRFVATVPDALQEMMRQPADVIISDLTLPIGGAALLEEIRDRYPATARLLLSGSGGTEHSMATIPVAHQFLEKPVDPRGFVRDIERACSIHRALTPGLRALIGGFSGLPSVPAVYQRLVELARDPHSSFVDATRVIASDPAIAARVLQVANSAFITSREPTASIAQAVARLGLGVITQLTLMTGVFRSCAGHKFPKGFSLANQQKHALVSAEIATSLLPDAQREDAYTTALLHNIGALLLATEMPERWSSLFGQAQALQQPVCRIEQQELGVTSAQVGAYLLALWGLPSVVVDAIGEHPAPLSDTLDLAGATHVAHVLAAERCNLPAYLDQQYLDRAGLTDHISDWRELAATVSIPRQ